MNGKCRRVKGCWSRGMSRGRPYNEEKNSVLYTLPVFSKKLKDLLTVEQKLLLSFFENYNYNKKVERFSYNNNTPNSIIYLYNSDFQNGTIRITTPGIYVLQENIVFNPNEFNDFSPTAEQISSGLYPQNMEGPFHLGFFSAITIETENVILDLNGFTIEQSENHKFQQRFYANIELANSPFIPNQGPGPFTRQNEYKPASKLLIMNGNLSSSSHHGIHGNRADKIVLHNLKIDDFEVAGIALNGTTLAILNEIEIFNNEKDIKVLSTYSQARFIRKFINLALERNPNLTLGNKTIQQIKNRIDNELLTTFNSFKNNGIIPNNFFKNNSQSGEYDGNVYGIVLNVNGVVINDFLRNRTPSMIGNKDIFLHKIIINNLSSEPVEIIGLNANPSLNTAYGGRVQVGPIGDVLQMEHIQDQNQNYDGTSLSDAQIILADSNYSGPNGTNNIISQIVEWAKGNTTLSSFIGTDPGKFYYISGGDSMNHAMKGNIGLFISGGINIKGQEISILNIKTKGNNVGSNPKNLTPIRKAVDLLPEKQGLAAYSILFTGSSDIYLNNIVDRLGQPVSDNGEALKVKFVGTNTNINLR